jgi:hypothetical protein
MQNNWYYPTPHSPCGIIIGCDEKQEWILPWWWKNYSACNTLPVLFVDFGLSKEAAEWCEQRGKRVCLTPDLPLAKPREEVEKTLSDRWEAAYGNGFWRARSSWFKKPFALLHTPFEKTLWLDVDCQVKKDLAPLFLEPVDDLSLVPEPEYAQAHVQAFSLCLENETLYNSGVILYRHQSPTSLQWANACHHRSDLFWSDQHLLSRLIFEKKLQVVNLPDTYNWHIALGTNEEAHIIHWLGDPGKEFICLNLHGFM